IDPEDVRKKLSPYTKAIIDALDRDDVPIIYYVNGGSAMLKKMKTAGSDVIGVDWRIGLDEAREQLGEDVAVQGNLDPVALFSSPERVKQRVKEIIDKNAGRPGHIFNLGQGVLPATPVEHVKLLVETVHEHSKKKRRR
ncbi:MAG: uroporphyrinogen decarboxylase family protein, partial [Terriglobia bacterium]